ncbi:MAG TPA: SURF1 family protein [Actinomycetes bacterium]|nr:SURF1 family protein [Actinomycetes bacterium]
MLRLLCTPKWLALTVLLLVCVAAFGWLSHWQWTRIHGSDTPELTSVQSRSVALRTVYQPATTMPDAAVGTSVRVDGRYVADDQLLVPDRLSGNQSGYWVLTPLRVDHGALLPVVRGWVSQAQDASAAPPTGPVTVTGWLEPSESDALRAGTPAVMPEGQIAIVGSAELVSRWSGSLYYGFVILDQQQPASSLTPVVPPKGEQSTGLSWQNLAYALQWSLFALFVAFLWWRMLQADLLDRAQLAAPSGDNDLSEAHS